MTELFAAHKARFDRLCAEAIRHDVRLSDQGIGTLGEKRLHAVIKRYLSDPEFKQLFEEQEYICLPHLELLLTVAKDKMRKGDFAAFSKVVIGLTDKYMKLVNDDVSHFCKMYDYRNAGGDWGNSRDSIERAILLLATRDYRTKD